MTKNDLKEYLNTPERVLLGLKVNIEKSIFGKIERGYLGFWVTNNGVITLLSKV